MGEVVEQALPVMEQFYTLQGEGVHQGKAAYFIRLGGCDVGCVWCDVKESWDQEKHPQWKIETLADQAAQFPGEIVVITGGEPLLHDLGPLTDALRKRSKKLHIETSGSSPLSGTWDWITLSPKKFKAPLPELLPEAHELKVVVYNASDLAWAEEYSAQVSSSCKLFLQPEWNKAAKVTPLIIDYIKEHPEWQLSLQIHKYINVP
jgi:7-carboxy-7-deazaguanine synthase